ATSVETIKSPLKDGDTGVTRTQRRGWELHQLGRGLRCLAFLLRVGMEGQINPIEIHNPNANNAHPNPPSLQGWEGVREWEEG
ncbi:hypothetical protein M422DRAFT_25820, partial [Sphaerobolus stellatus SS14]